MTYRVCGGERAPCQLCAAAVPIPTAGSATACLLLSDCCRLRAPATACSCIANLQQDGAQLTARHTQLAAEQAQAQERAGHASQALPQLEAAKRAAAAKKDFREAGRLAAEARTLTLEVDRLQVCGGGGRRRGEG